MANPSSKWLEAISVLIELTQQGKLKWQNEPPRLGSFADKFAGGTQDIQSFRTKYQESIFRLSHNKPTTFGEQFIVRTRPTYRLELIDESGGFLYEVPEMSGLADLYQAVQYQLAGVDKVLESLLQEKKS